MKKQGFTLIELLTAITLVSVLLLITIPAFQQVLAHNRATNEVNKIISALHYARSEAIQLNETVSFCKSANAKQCGGNWEDGQIIVANNRVLRVYPSLPANTRLYLKGNFGNNDIIRWLPNGATAGQKGSIYYCPADERYARRIVLEKTGRVRVETTSCHPERSEGSQ